MKYRNHPSINNIRNSSQRFSSFYVSQVDTNTVLKESRRLSAKKAAQDIDIPVKVLKENAEFFADQICRQFNEAICSSKFPATFKFANVTPIISKIFEKLICRQLSQHFNKICSKFQCSFRQGFNAQHCLLLMIDKWKKTVDNNKAFSALLTDLSKAFDCICHDLPVAKLHAYGLSLPPLKLIQDYLLNRKKKQKQNRILLHYMGEHYIWCSTRLYFRTSVRPLA